MINPQLQTQKNFLRKELITQSFLDFKRSTRTETFPQEFTDFLRLNEEIYYYPSGGFHVITKADDARNILTNPSFSADRSKFFISKAKNIDLSLIQDFFSIIQKMMLMSDGKLHQMRRKSASSGISDSWINSFQPVIEKIVNQLLDDITQDKEVEFVSKIARVLPSTILAELFCIPEQDREFFRSCADTMTAFFGGGVEYTNEVAKKTNTAAANIRDYFIEILQERRKKPQNDFLSGMLEAQEQFNLSDAEIVSQATMMLVAGQVSTTDQICNNLFLLLNNSEIFQIIKSNLQLLPNALEEFKRFDPAVTFLFRVAIADVVINGQLIKAGETTFISNHCVNRDLPENESPNELNIHRQSFRHFAYGYGMHYCLGALLARLQIQQLFSSMITRFPSMQFSPNTPVERDHYAVAFSGFKKIPLMLNNTD